MSEEGRSRFIRGPYVGAGIYLNQDSRYRHTYRVQPEFRSFMSDVYRDLYDSQYGGLLKQFSAGSEAAYADFLGRLKSGALSQNPNHLEGKLSWTSLEYYFASAAKHYEDKKLAFDYRFYASSALVALDTLIQFCDDQREQKIPFVLIATTELPNEYISSPNGAESALSEKSKFQAAKQKYIRQFRQKISNRVNSSDARSLIVERHIFAARDCKSLQNLTSTADLATGYRGAKLDFSSDKKSNAFVDWLNGNHCWFVAGRERKPPAVNAFINILSESQLPMQGTAVVPPSDEGNCIDFIAFGIAAMTDNSEINVDWRFGIGVFAGISPTDLQGRFVKLFTGDELSDEAQPFSFLGYELPSFKRLVRALHGAEKISELIYLRPPQSTLLIDSAPWENWFDRTSATEEHRKRPTLRFVKHALKAAADELGLVARLVKQSLWRISTVEGLFKTIEDLFFALVAIAIVTVAGSIQQVLAWASSGAPISLWDWLLFAGAAGTVGLIWAVINHWKRS